MDLHGKLALVTGSTSGIGLGIAHALAKVGCDIILTGFGDPLEIEGIKSDISSHGVSAEYIFADFLKVSDIDKMVEEIHKNHPDGVDILINNAGLFYIKPIDEFPDKQWDTFLAVHLSAPFHLIKRLLPKMKQKGWGRIINMSSQLGFVSDKGKSVYSAVKSGIIGLTKGVALEVAELGITCNAVCPTFANTKGMEFELEELSKKNGTSYEEELERKYTKHIPTKKLVEVDEIADLFLYLIRSKASKQMTGGCYLIDGGYTAQ